MEWIAGKNAVLEALRAGKRKPHTLYLSRNVEDESTREILNLARKLQLTLKEANAREIGEKSGVEAHQGVALEISPFVYADLSEVVSTSLVSPKGSFLLLLDEIQDPQNVGALIRTAHLTGAKGMIVLKHRSASITPTVVKASAGATEYLPIVQEVNLVNCINLLKDKGFDVIGADGESDQNIYQYSCQWPVALVLGSEGKGLRRLVRESCNSLISLPMMGPVGSYNVSVAGALFMGEILRQKMALTDLNPVVAPSICQGR